MEPYQNSNPDSAEKRKTRWRGPRVDCKIGYPKAVENISNDLDNESHVDIKAQQLSTSSLLSDELHQSTVDTSPVSIVNRFNKRRTKQLLVICSVTGLFALVNNLVNQQSLITTQVLVASFLMFGLSYVLAQNKQVELAGRLLIWSLFAIVSTLMVSNDGLRDPVVFGYAGILIFSAMLGRKSDFLFLISFIGLAYILVGFANYKGWLDYSKNPFGWGIVFDLLIIFSAVSYAIWMLATDLRYALQRLEIENLRVNKSKLAYQRIAQYDLLTGLPNRIIALDRFKQAIVHAHRDNSMVAILFIDLDNFKTVNDSLGHEVGDKLLQEVSKRMQFSVRDGDTVCRVGGDEFLIILDGIIETTDVTKISNNVLTNMAEIIQIEQHQLMATCSIGIAISPTDGEDFDDLRKKADMAMYRAKKAGRNGLMFFDQVMNKDMLAHIDRVNGLRTAIANREFELHYQPKVDLRSGRIFSAEALIRWRLTNGELIYPNDFIAIAENTGLIIELGEWVLYEACRQCKEFQQNGLQDFSIAVNLSSIQFRRGNLAEMVNGALASANLDPSYLELEVTESLLIEDAIDIKRQIESLQSIGVAFSIDDFGTGYSSLAYLKDFNFDYLKIDRSFVAKSVERENDMILCEAIVSMAHKLKLLVIAEGLENEQQRNALATAGCEFGQGNYFSAAMPVDEFYRYYELASKKLVRAKQMEDYIGSFV